MSKPFKGVVNVDIRDSTPDWAPFEPPKAPEGAPNVVYIVLDDVGFSAMGCYGGPDRDAEHRPDRRRRPALHAVAHDGAVLADALLPAHRPQPHAQLHGLHHRGGRSAFPNASGTIPPENGMLSEILGERGWNTYMVGKWHLCPTDEMNLASTAAQLADRPRLRALVRLPGRRDQPVVSGPGLRQPPGRPAEVAGRGLPPDRRHHRQGASSSSRTPRRSRPTSPSSSTTRRAPAMRRTTCPRSGPTSTRAASTWATRRCASRPWPARRSWASCRPTPSCRRSTRSARPRPERAPRASRSRRSTSPGRGTR